MRRNVIVILVFLLAGLLLLSSCGQNNDIRGGRTIRCVPLQVDLFQSNASLIVDQFLNPSVGLVRNRLGGVDDMLNTGVGRNVRFLEGGVRRNFNSRFVVGDVISQVDRGLLEFEAAVIQARCSFNDLRNQIRNEERRLNPEDPAHAPLLKHLTQMKSQIDGVESTLRGEVHDVADHVVDLQDRSQGLIDGSLNFGNPIHWVPLTELYQVNSFLIQVERRIRRSF